MIRYTYKDKKHTSLYTLRQAIWDNDHTIFGDLTDELKTRFNITEEEYDPRDEWTEDQWADMVRGKRDSMLSGTDYYILPDYSEITPENLELIKVYRQALRDIPEQAGFPRNVKWPVVPAFMTRKSSKLGLAKAGELAKASELAKAGELAKASELAKAGELAKVGV